MDPRLRIAPAILVLVIPAAAFIFNSFISQQERGFFDVSDLIAAGGFLLLAWMVWRRSRIGVFAGIVLAGIYLLSTVASGPIQFVAYWLLAIALLAESLRVIREPAAAA